MDQRWHLHVSADTLSKRILIYLSFERSTSMSVQGRNSTNLTLVLCVRYDYNVGTYKAVAL